MDGIATCDLLKNHGDLHPIITGYLLTELDIAVNESAVNDYHYDPDYPAILMKYWDMYKAEMIHIFENSFPEEDIPRWVSQDVFKHDMLVDMADTLFDYLSDDIHENDRKRGSIIVNFVEPMLLPFCARKMSYDMIQWAEDYTSIDMIVKTAIINEYSAKASS